MHDRHNKDEVSSFEQYCDIIAKMMISHDPKMHIVSRVLFDVAFPTLNKAAHDVKERFWRTMVNGFRRTIVVVCKKDGTTSTQHASDKASRTGGDIGMSASMGSGGDMSTSTSMVKGT